MILIIYAKGNIVRDGKMRITLVTQYLKKNHKQFLKGFKFVELF